MIKGEVHFSVSKTSGNNIDRKIGGNELSPDEQENTRTAAEKPRVNDFKPYTGKIRKSGTGHVSQISENLWEGRYSPKVNGKRIARIIYAHSPEECEKKLAKLIIQKKSDIAEKKMNASKIAPQ